MKLTHQDVFGAYNALGQLARQSLPIQTSLKVRRAVKAIEPEHEPLSETRQEIVQEHAKKDPDTGRPVQEDGGVALEDPDAFSEAMAELMDGQVEVEVDPIPLEEITDAELSPRALNVLLETRIVESGGEP